MMMTLTLQEWVIQSHSATWGRRRSTTFMFRSVKPRGVLLWTVTHMSDITAMPQVSWWQCCCGLPQYLTHASPQSSHLSSWPFPISVIVLLLISNPWRCIFYIIIHGGVYSRLSPAFNSPHRLTFMWWGCCGLCFEINQLSLLTTFYSVLVWISFFKALSIVFHSVNSPSNFPFSYSVFLYLFFTTYVSMKVSFSLDTILCSWLGLKHQLTNLTKCF